MEFKIMLMNQAATDREQKWYNVVLMDSDPSEGIKDEVGVKKYSKKFKFRKEEETLLVAHIDIVSTNHRQKKNTKMPRLTRKKLKHCSNCNHITAIN
jgi:CO dehydrogenase nickel-insertion accessory protein CooC1